MHARSNWELKTLLIIALLFALPFSQPVLFPFFIVFFLYLLLDPIYEWLIKRKIPEKLAAFIIVISLFGIIGLGISFFVKPAAEWMGRAPEIFQLVERKISFIKIPLNKINKAAETAQHITSTTQEHPVEVVNAPTLSSSIFNLTTSAIIFIFTILMLLFFTLIYFKYFLQHLEHILYNKHKDAKENKILTQLKNNISQYMLTFALICIGVGSIMAMVFWLTGLPNPILWGLMAMFLTFIPYLGHFIGITIITLVSLITFDSYIYILLPPFIYLLITAMEGQIISPIIMGNRLNINPFLIIYSMFFWGWAWGISGIIIAVPLLLTLKVIIVHVPSLASYKTLFER
jgi:predicted PurR-regulated permease PerM